MTIIIIYLIGDIIIVKIFTTKKKKPIVHEVVISTLRD